MPGPAQLREQIELVLAEITKAPADLSLYQKLRDAALQHKAAGGRDLGLIARIKIAPKDPLQRLIHTQRLWSFNPGSSDRAVTVLQALENHAQSAPNTDIEPIRRWLVKILMRMESDRHHPIS
jgi:hypothetical protein